MINLINIPDSKEDLDSYEVKHNFQSWSYQPAQSPPRVVSAKGVRFTTEVTNKIDSLYQAIDFLSSDFRLIINL